MIKPHRLYYKTNLHGYIKTHRSSCKVLRDKWCINHQTLYYYTLDWGREHMTGPHKKTPRLCENVHFICQRLKKHDNINMSVRKAAMIYFFVKMKQGLLSHQ